VGGHKALSTTAQTAVSPPTNKLFFEANPNSVAGKIWFKHFGPCFSRIRRADDSQSAFKVRIGISLIDEPSRALAEIIAGLPILFAINPKSCLGKLRGDVAPEIIRWYSESAAFLLVIGQGANRQTLALAPSGNVIGISPRPEQRFALATILTTMEFTVHQNRLICRQTRPH